MPLESSTLDRKLGFPFASKMERPLDSALVVLVALLVRADAALDLEFRLLILARDRSEASGSAKSFSSSSCPPSKLEGFCGVLDLLSDESETVRHGSLGLSEDAAAAGAALGFFEDDRRLLLLLEDDRLPCLEEDRERVLEEDRDRVLDADLVLETDRERLGEVGAPSDERPSSLELADLLGK